MLDLTNLSVTFLFHKLSSYCGSNPTLQLGNPKDFQVVCSEWDIGPVSEQLSTEDEIILEVIGFKNHPNFDINVGPIGL